MQLSWAVLPFAFATLVSSYASADEDPKASPPAAQPAPPAPLPTAARPASAITVGNYTCTSGEHDGVDANDVRTVTDIVCHELAKQHATVGNYEVRVGKLGTRILLSVSGPTTGEERRALVQGVEEMASAAPRVVQALVRHTSVEETTNADNVLASETPAPRVKAGQSGAYLGLIGMSGVGMPASVSGGFDLGIIFRNERLAFTLHGRAGGIGSSDVKLGFADLDVGGRYYLSDGDFAPFVGGGLGFAYLQLNGVKTETFNGYTYRDDLSGSGFGAFAELGIDIARTNRVGFTTSLRADAPFFTVKSGDDSRYIVPLSLNAGLSFH